MHTTFSFVYFICKIYHFNQEVYTFLEIFYKSLYFSRSLHFLYKNFINLLKKRILRSDLAKCFFKNIIWPIH